jgi:cytidylate kinase
MERSPRSVDAIVEEQVRRWLMEREKARKIEPSRPRPVVAVSRQYGARGAELARIVAGRLGFECWDQQIIHEIARNAHASEQLISSFDEHRRAVIWETVNSMMHKDITASDYFRELGRVLHSIAAHGAAVIVGRGAQYMLDGESVLRVRAVAPLDRRIRGLVERKGIGEREARAELEEADRDRRDFIHDHYGRSIDEPADYDLIVNTGTLSLEAAAEIVVQAYKVRFGELAR